MSQTTQTYQPRILVYVPNAPSRSYEEACALLEISPSASAILSRRCLEQLLQSLGYRHKNLAKAISSVEENEGRLFCSLSESIRHVGNIAAHASYLDFSDHPLEIEYEDALWSLQILEALFDILYELPLQYEMHSAIFQGRLHHHKMRMSQTNTPEL